MGQGCCSGESTDPVNFTFLTRSVSYSRLGNDLQLNKQGLEAEVFAAVQKAELRKGNLPVNILEIWRCIELNSRLHSKKFKVALLDLYKQGEVFADDSLCYFSTDVYLLRSKLNKNAKFLSCLDLIQCKFPTYKFDKIYRIVPTRVTPVVNFHDLKSLLLSTDAARYHELDCTIQRVFLDGKVDIAL